MALLLYARRHIRRERVFRDRINPLDSFGDVELLKRYRMDRASIFSLIDSLGDSLDRQTDRSMAIPPSLQIMIALRFYSSGTFQSVIGDVHGISAPTVSRVLRSVTRALVESRHPNLSFVFPTTPEQQMQAKESFHQIAGFPKVISCIDGTHIAIKCPSENEPSFVCRKGFHSLNVQATTDAHLRVTSVLARFPGSTHDSFILASSALSAKFEDGTYGDSILLGDSGYPLRPWLMIPFHEPQTPAQRSFNKSLKTTRCSIERAFGVIKARFRCLDHKSGGCLMYSPQVSAEIVVAVFKLNNFCIDRRLPLPADSALHEDDVDHDLYTGHMNDGKGVRQELVNQRFS